MLKFFKRVNKFGLVAILLAGTTAFAFKAPAKSKRDLQQYANTSPNGTTHWILNTREEGGDPGNYTCSEASKPCTAFFSSQPSDGTTGGSDTETGQYTVIP